MFSHGRLSRWIWGFVGLGLALRTYHYLRGRPVWHDEAALVLSVLDLDFMGLLGPLHFHEAAPPLFLWLLKVVSLVLGDGPVALRLIPFLASCAALILFAGLFQHLLRDLGEGQKGLREHKQLKDIAAVVAVLVLALSDNQAWHASEAKSYAVDTFLGVLVLCLYLSLREQLLSRRLLLIASLAPLMIWVSYPACFLLGGLLLVLLPAVVRAPWPVRWAYLVVAVTVVGAFLALVLGPVRAQHDTVIHSDWVLRFMPDWSKPAYTFQVPLWMLGSTVEVFRYNCDPAGGILAPLGLLGTLILIRCGLRDLAVLCLAPLALTLVAACLHRYPYGGARVVAFAAPAVALLLGVGVATVWERLRQQQSFSLSLLGRGALVGLLLWPGTLCLRHVVSPWPDADIPGAVEFIARHRQENEVVLGNDWTHGYYFRYLGDLFSPCVTGRSPALEHGGRVWVVWTQKGATHEERMRAARAQVPPGWKLEQDADLFATSVVCFCRIP